MKIGKAFKKILLISFSALAFSSCSSNKKPSLINAGISEDVKFKAAIVNSTIDDFNKLGFELGDSCDVEFSNGYKLNDVPYFNGYYVKNGSPVIVAYPANEYVMVTLNNTGIWDKAELDEGTTVSITLNEAKKYSATQEALGQSYSLDRDQYTTDEEFSNFRALSGGRLKEKCVYRGASPVDNSRKRAKCTDTLLEKNKINSIVDLADSDEDMQKYFSNADFSSTYTKSLYEKGNVITLSMGSGYESDNYKQSVVKGFKHMLKTEGPYYVHCMEGKDRTGFVCTLIEALLGATYEEMCADYMKTYENYYKITKESAPDKYNAIVSLYFDSFIEALVGTKSKETPNNYVDFAKKYLFDGGMTNDEAEAFINLLSK